MEVVRRGQGVTGKDRSGHSLGRPRSEGGLQVHGHVEHNINTAIHTLPRVYKAFVPL